MAKLTRKERKRLTPEVVMKAKAGQDLTDEEYDILDDFMTKTDLKLDFSRPGPLTRQQMLIDSLDEVSANYLKKLSEELQHVPTKVIADMLRERMAVSVTHGDTSKIDEAVPMKEMVAQ